MKPNLTQFSLDRRRQVVPVLVWVLAVAAVIFLFRGQIHSVSTPGIALCHEHELAATSSGRVKSIFVTLLDRVQSGQLLALMDDSARQADLATARAQIEKLQAELHAAENQWIAENQARQTDAAATARRFAADVTSTRLRILELQAVLEPDRLKLLELELEREAAQSLYEKGLLATVDVETKNVKKRVLSRRIEENERLLEQSRIELENAQRRYDLFIAESEQPQDLDAQVASSLNVFRKAILVQERRIEKIETERAGRVLRAPFDGIVTAMPAQPGEVVTAGQDILTLTPSRPKEILAYVSERQGQNISAGELVDVTVMRDRKTKLVHAEVTRVGATVMQVPPRWTHHPQLDQWGQPFVVAIPDQLDLLPGEKVDIHFR